MVTAVKSSVNTSVSASASAYCYTLKEPNYENQYLIYLASSETKPDIHMLRSFSLDALTDLMNQSISKRIVAILDCCHSGAAKSGRGRVNEEDTVSVAANAIDNKSKHLEKEKEDVF